VRAQAAAPRRFTVGPAERPRPRRSIPWRRIGLGLGGVALTGGLIYGLAFLLLGDTLRVRDIYVHGTQIADPQEVVSTAGLSSRSLITLDTAGAAARLDALPEIKSATVHRQWPHSVVIDVVERQAWGYWQSGGKRVVIDENGLILQKARPPAANAPTIIEIGGPLDFTGDRITDPDTVHLVAQLTSDGTLDRLHVHPTGFVFRHDRGLTVLVDGGPDVVFGDSSNYGFKVATWAALLQELSQEQRTAREIDLRFGQRVVMR
jgi:cell division protein FtsQ